MYTCSGAQMSHNHQVCLALFCSASVENRFQTDNLTRAVTRKQHRVPLFLSVSHIPYCIHLYKKTVQHAHDEQCIKEQDADGSR